MKVENLGVLHSVKSGSERQVHVLVRNGRGPTETTIHFDIGGKKYSQCVALEPNEVKNVSTTHEEKGRCKVVVTASGSLVKTSKKLDLDAPESF
jgi:hypothetical protein